MSYNHNGLKNKLERGVVVGTLAALGTVGVAGCNNETSAASTPKASETVAAPQYTPTPEAPKNVQYPKISELKLTPPSLSPEAAAAMTPVELSKALQITSADIDMNNFGQSYAEAVVDRQNTTWNLGLIPGACANQNHDTFNPDVWRKENSDKYTDLANTATFGDAASGWSHDLPNILYGMWCWQEVATATNMWLGKPEPGSKTVVGSTLVPDTATATKNPDGSYTGSFEARNTLIPPKGVDPQGINQLKSADQIAPFSYTVHEENGRWVASEITIGAHAVPQN